MSTYRPDLIDESYLNASVPAPDLSDSRWVMREPGTRIRKNDWMSRYNCSNASEPTTPVSGEWALGAAGSTVSAAGTKSQVYYWDHTRAIMSENYVVTLPPDKTPNEVSFNATSWVDAALFVHKEYPLATNLKRLPK